MTRILLSSVLLVVAVALSAAPAAAAPAEAKPATPAKAKGNADAGDGNPTLFLVGDSTVKNSTKGQEGWGSQIGKYFDPEKITIANHAIGGRSSRSFQAEGRWDKVLAELKPGDFVLIQFGHNDGANPKDPKSDPRGRGSLRGMGDETAEVTNAANGKKETVHTYGWYMKKYAADAKAKGATPIILSLVPRNIWKDGKVVRGHNTYAGWAKQAAEAENVPFVDLHEICARRYESLGQDTVKTFFPHEHTHTNTAGADVNAQCVIAGLKGLKETPLVQYLSEKGREIATSERQVK